MNGIAPRSQPLSDKDWILTDGLNWLVKATGRAEKGLRSQIGLWRKTLKDDSEELRSVFEAAQDADYADPIGSITKAVAVRANPTVPFQQTDEYGWRKRFRLYKENPVWPAPWGGKFPGDHPEHPKALLAEFGFQAQAGGAQ